jgi:hypothetical protein
MYPVSFGRIVLEVVAATCVVGLLTWIAMGATATLIAVVNKTPPRYSVRSLLVLMTDISIALAIAAP